jgi:adenine-specific DNA-methyltransferase
VPKTVETFKHVEDTRTNIPTAEYQSVVKEADQAPVRLAYERRNRDLDPQLVWRGKDVQDWSDLVVHAPPLYIQEKVHPKVLIDDLIRESEPRVGARDQYEQIDLFADFNGFAEGTDRTDFYQHEQNWTNRMILGDSLQVMASLAEREGLRGKVQCIYLDPPYGIKFNSNFQWSTTSRTGTDGKAGHITREPEQVKAFRDTWRDGSRAVSGVTCHWLAFGKARHESTFWRTSLMIEVGSYCCCLVERPFPSSKTISSCCAGVLRFFGFGMGVMNSARRRFSKMR